MYCAAIILTGFCNQFAVLQTCETCKAKTHWCRIFYQKTLQRKCWHSVQTISERLSSSKTLIAVIWLLLILRLYPHSAGGIQKWRLQSEKAIKCFFVHTVSRRNNLKAQQSWLVTSFLTSSISKMFSAYTRKQRAGVFKSLRFEERF